MSTQYSHLLLAIFIFKEILLGIKLAKFFIFYFYFQEENINFINVSRLNQLVKQIVFVVKHPPFILKNLRYEKHIQPDYEVQNCILFLHESKAIVQNFRITFSHPQVANLLVLRIVHSSSRLVSLPSNLPPKQHVKSQDLLQRTKLQLLPMTRSPLPSKVGALPMHMKLKPSPSHP